MYLILPQKKQFKKRKKATGDLTGEKIADKIIKIFKTIPQNNSETVENETENTRLDRKIPKRKICISKRQKDRKLQN